jgi:hypothetical protein
MAPGLVLLLMLLLLLVAVSSLLLVDLLIGKNRLNPAGEGFDRSSPDVDVDVDVDDMMEQ